jgi:MFS family permease
MMKTKTEKAEADELKRGESYAVKDGAAIAVRDNVLTNFMTPFALFLGAGVEIIGLLTAIPQLAGAIFAPFAGKFIECAKDRKKITLQSLLLSHLVWAPVALLPLFMPRYGLWVLMAVLILSQLARSMGSTGWTSWMADIIPRETFGKFFGKRNMAASTAAFFSLIIGGWVLGTLGPTNGFVMLFLTAVMFGLISYSLLRKIPDIERKGCKTQFSFKLDLRGMFEGNENLKNFTKMAVIFNFAVYVASPFFAVYMLRELNVGYEWYALMIALEALVAIIAQPYWGRLADRYGDRPLMASCGLLIAAYPALWLFINSPLQIIPAAMLSGFAWAGFDLTSFNYMLDVTHPEHRPVQISNFKSIAAVGIVAGPIVGGALAVAFQSTTILWITGLQIVFLISFILRGSSILLFMHKLKEARVKKHYHIRKLFWKVVAIYPIRGIMHDFSVALHLMEGMEKGVAGKERMLFKEIKAA